ncbi:unnamed protein product [Ectocarpus sp. 12 AP-2014]
MSRTPLLSGVRKRTQARASGGQGKSGTTGSSWCAEQPVFGRDMRRIARTHWDADGPLDHRENLSPRSQQLDGEYLLPLACIDDSFGDHTGGGAGVGGGAGAGGAAGGGGGGGSSLASGMEAGISAGSPRAGGIGSVGAGVTSPRDRDVYGGGGGRKRGKGERRRFFLRIHKFVFQKELALHFSMCILSIAIPFSLSGSPWLAAIPVCVWCFYNAMFVMGAKRASTVLPGFDRFKRSFVAAMEEFLPPRLVPVLSLSFLSVVIAVTLTAARLGGPPLCISSCRTCLGSWKHAHPTTSLQGRGAAASPSVEASRSRSKFSPNIVGAFEGAKRGRDSAAAGDYRQAGGSGGGGESFWVEADEAAPARGSQRAKSGEACGYANGKELLAYYTVSQSAILIYLAVMTGLLTCLAWKVSEEELAQRQAAESRLKGQNPRAFELRERMILEHGRPGSSVRPETTCPWLMFGLVAACTFMLIGWRKWGDLPVTAVTVVVIGANVTTTLASVLMLHVGFHGRLIALYQGNLQRVQFLSKLLREGTSKAEEPWVHAAEAWWFLRSFVLREDLSLDYDVGGLGVSATFFIVLASFVVAVAQIVREGLDAMLNPPGSYCAYASVYLTVCLIRIFGLATKTYLEQQLHVGIIQDYIDNLAAVTAKTASSSASELKKGRDQPSPSLAPSLTAGISATTSTNTAAATVAERVAADNAADPNAANSLSEPSPANASLLAAARAAVTGTSALGDAGGRRDTRDRSPKAAEGGGSGGGARDLGVAGNEGEALLHPAQEAMRRMIVHIDTLDPYPCVLGIPVKPALFATSKVYVFGCFAVISVKLMYDVISGMI